MKVRLVKKGLDEGSAKGSFYFNGKLVATARYDQSGYYIFFDVNGNIVGKSKSKELGLPKDRAKAWEKLATTFGDYKEPEETKPTPVEQKTEEKPKVSITKVGDSINKKVVKK